MTDHEFEGPKEADEDRAQQEPVEAGALEEEPPDADDAAGDGDASPHE